MLATLLAATALAQPPRGPAQSPEDARAEARHLRDVRQVTFGFPKAGEGYFSPDGTRIIFQAVPPVPPSIFPEFGPDADGYQIYLGSLEEGSTPKLVSTGRGRCTCAAFHPDGESILYASTHADPDGSKARAARGEPEPSAEPAYNRTEGYRWDFPDGMDIYRAGLNGEDPVQLTDTPGYDAEGSYSPDGSKIIFTSFRDGDAEIYIMDADGSNPRRITETPGYDGGPFFSPDGSKIIYRSDRNGNDLLQVFINNPEGTDEKALTADEYVNWGPYFHPDGDRIVFATSQHGHANYEVYLLNVNTGTRERITHHEGFDGLPVFSPDGHRMMWTSSGRTKDKQSQLFIADFLDPAPPAQEPEP